MCSFLPLCPHLLPWNLCVIRQHVLGAMDSKTRKEQIYPWERWCERQIPWRPVHKLSLYDSSINTPSITLSLPLLFSHNHIYDNLSFLSSPQAAWEPDNYHIVLFGNRAPCFDYAINVVILVVSELSWITVHCGSSLFDLCVCFPWLCTRIQPVSKYPECMEHSMGRKSQDFTVYLCKCVCRGALEDVPTLWANRLQQRVTKYWNISQCEDYLSV